MFKRILNFWTHRIYNLPIIVMMPHSRCNCRCVMCDIWKANNEKREISTEDLGLHVESFRKLGVREIVFSGGEALMHSNLFRLCDLLKANRIRLTLLSTGLLLEKNANDIVRHMDNVIVSIDGSEPVHDRIRNIPSAYRKMKEGILAIRKVKAKFKVTGRCVIQKQNYFDFVNIIAAAKDLGLDQISFLAADVSSAAFNHVSQLPTERIDQIALNLTEAGHFKEILHESFLLLKSEFDRKYIAETPAKMLKLVQYYRAINRDGDFPETVCDAPWVSAVIESNGDVMPCFFHKPYGNIRSGDDFRSIINSDKAIGFRKNLDMNKDDTCRKCVCSLKLGLTQMT